MNRNYKKMKSILNEYKVPDIPDHVLDHVFNETEKRLDFQEITDRSSWIQQILGQIRYISVPFWIAQITAIVFTIIVAMQMAPDKTSLRHIILMIFPMVSILSLYGIPEITKSHFYNMVEIESVCKKGYAKMIETRMLIIGLVEMTVILAISIFLGSYFKQDILILLVYGLVPFNLVHTTGLYVAQKFQSKYGVYLFIFLDILVGVTLDYIINRARAPISGNGIQNLWTFLFLITLAMLCYQIYKFIKSCNQKEELYLWN